MNNTVFNKILFLIFGLIAGIGATVFFTGSPKQLSTITTVPAATFQSNALAREQTYQEQVDSLTTSYGKLKTHTSTVETALIKARKQSMALQSNLGVMADNLTESPDPTLLDSMRSLVISSSFVGESKDSLCDEIITSLTTEVDNRDSLIDLQKQNYQALRLDFTSLVTQDNCLQIQNRSLLKHAQRQRIESKLLIAGMTVLSGIAAYSLLRN